MESKLCRHKETKLEVIEKVAASWKSQMHDVNINYFWEIDSANWAHNYGITAGKYKKAGMAAMCASTFYHASNLAYWAKGLDASKWINIT